MLGGTLSLLNHMDIELWWGLLESHQVSIKSRYRDASPTKCKVAQLTALALAQPMHHVEVKEVLSIKRKSCGE